MRPCRERSKTAKPRQASPVTLTSGSSRGTSPPSPMPTCPRALDGQSSRAAGRSSPVNASGGCEPGVIVTHSHFTWSPAHVQDVCAFIEQLPHVEGRWATPTIHARSRGRCSSSPRSTASARPDGGRLVTTVFFQVGAEDREDRRSSRRARCITWSSSRSPAGKSSAAPRRAARRGSCSASCSGWSGGRRGCASSGSSPTPTRSRSTRPAAMRSRSTRRARRRTA